MLADHLLKTKKELKNFKNWRFKVFLSKKINKACFQEEIGYEDFKDLTRGTADDRALCDKAFNIAKN